MGADSLPLDALEDLGLIRPEVTEIGHGRYWMTDRGRKLLDGDFA